MHHSGSIGGISRSSLATMAVPTGLVETPATPPAEWANAWSVAQYVPQVGLVHHADGAVATLDKTAAEIFDLFSTARSAPANTYHVSPNGNDSTGDGTENKPYRSIWKAVAVANASGQPAAIMIKAGEYGKPYNPSQFLSLRPSVDIAFVATGGRVITGTWDDFPASSIDATYQNCYSYTLGNVDRVIDRVRHDADGFFPNLQRVTDAATCNRIPGSWTLQSGKIYINRADGLPVTNANTRVLRSSGGSWRFDTPVSIFVGAGDSISGFDTMGGSDGAAFHYQPTSKPASMKAVVVERSTFSYCGGAAANSNGTLIADLHGLALFVDCDASNNSKDGFSASNESLSGSESHFVTVNCRAVLCGRGSAQSCNSFTTHQDVVGADLAGEFGRTNGGSVRCIGDTLTWLAGTRIKDDRGDLVAGGGTTPAAIMANERARIWADRARIAMPPARAHASADADALVSLRAMPPLRSGPQGNGTVANW
ncbi:DUF1565 domain-containing protein [Croceicoccus bisphenolivorans]|uniref:DUF1565 domain-containing protein n=1 Tax=Croceicoccus bisphenolivorans TaxID=1783232 RepID=UPI000836A818|nr:DUF1565 domain-containing protein [Croceicoccus bisphenolivorans]